MARRRASRGREPAGVRRRRRCRGRRPGSRSARRGGTPPRARRCMPTTPPGPPGRSGEDSQPGDQADAGHDQERGPRDVEVAVGDDACGRGDRERDERGVAKGAGIHGWVPPRNPRCTACRRPTPQKSSYRPWRSKTPTTATVVHPTAMSAGHGLASRRRTIWTRLGQGERCHRQDRRDGQAELVQFQRLHPEHERRGQDGQRDDVGPRCQDHLAAHHQVHELDLAGRPHDEPGRQEAEQNGAPWNFAGYSTLNAHGATRAARTIPGIRYRAIRRAVRRKKAARSASGLPREHRVEHLAPAGDQVVHRLGQPPGQDVQAHLVLGEQLRPCQPVEVHPPAERQGVQEDRQPEVGQLVDRRAVPAPCRGPRAEYVRQDQPATSPTNRPRTRAQTVRSARPGGS